MNKISIHYVFTFGKYKGCHIEQVIENNPNYVLWCNENIAGFNLSNTVFEECYAQLDYYDMRPAIEEF